MNRRNPESQQDTKQRILDSAEALFAENGYRGTSMRQITTRANANVAAVNYHFGSKKELLEEVIRRRIIPLNQIRIKRLEAVRATAKKKKKTPDIKEVLLAFIEPTLRFRESSEGASNFFTLIGRSLTDPDDTVRTVFMRHIKTVGRLLFELTYEALPDYPKEVVFWRLHFAIGSVFHTIHMCGKLNVDFLDMSSDINTESMIRLIIPFITAGMKAK